MPPSGPYCPWPFCPYVGLQPCAEEHEAYFFGRDRDRRIISSSVYSTHVTILYGPSGVGKSSILMAGVVPDLRKKDGTAVVVFREWQRTDYLSELKSALLRELTERLGQQDLSCISTELPLDEVLFEAGKRFDMIVILLDQFEEYLLNTPASESGNSFDSEFARAVNRKDVDVSFLISLREEALAILDERFRKRIPNLLGNTLRLQHLNREAAEEAIRKPLTVYENDEVRQGDNPGPVTIDDGLVLAILADKNMKAGQSYFSGFGGMGQIEASGNDDRFEAPLLQLVMTRLWEKERENKSQRLRQDTLNLGETKVIVQSHVEERLNKLNKKEEKELCAQFFDRMVTPSGTKIACYPEDLVSWAKRNLKADGRDLVKEVKATLGTLAGEDYRILRTVPGPPNEPGKYEIFHDVLAPAILLWQRSFLEEQRVEAEIGKQKTRLTVLMCISVVLLLVVVFGGWYLSEQHSITQRNEDIRSTLTKAFAKLNMNEWDNATSLFESALALDSDLAVANDGLGQALMRKAGAEADQSAAKSIYSRANENFDKAVKRAEKPPRDKTVLHSYYLNLAESFLSLGKYNPEQYDAAMIWFDNCIRELVIYNQSLARVYIGRGNVYNQKKDIVNALEEYQQAAVLARDNPWLFVSMTGLYLDKHREQGILEKGYLREARIKLERAKELVKKDERYSSGNLTVRIKELESGLILAEQRGSPE